MSSKDPIISLFKPYLGADANLLLGKFSPYFYDNNKNPISTSVSDYAGTQYKSYEADKTTPVDTSNTITADNTGLIYYSNPNVSILPDPIKTTSAADTLYPETSYVGAAPWQRVTSENNMLIVGSNGVPINIPGNGRYPLPRLLVHNPQNFDSLSDGAMLTSFTKGAGTPTVNRARLEAPTGYLITGIKCSGVNYWVPDGGGSFLSTITHIFATPIVNLLNGNNNGTIKIGIDANGSKMSEMYAQNTKFNSSQFEGGVNPDNFSEWMLPQGFALCGFKLIDKYAINILVLLGANVADAAKGIQTWNDKVWIHAATTNAGHKTRQGERRWYYLISTRPNEAERKADFIVGFQYYNDGYLTRAFEAIKYVTIIYYAKWLSDRTTNYDMVKMCCDPSRNKYQLSNLSTAAVCKPYYYDNVGAVLEKSINYPICDIDVTTVCKNPAHEKDPFCSCLTPLSVLAPGTDFVDTGQPNMCWWKDCRNSGYKSLENRTGYETCPAVNLCRLNSNASITTLDQGKTDNVKISQSCNVSSNTGTTAPPPPPASGGTGTTAPPPAGTGTGTTVPPPPPASGGTTTGTETTSPPPATNKPKPEGDSEGFPTWAIILIIVAIIIIIISVIIIIVVKRRKQQIQKRSDDSDDER